jgi:hypothetical protein
MKRIRLIRLCLVAAFAMSAAAVTTASATPDYGRCKALTGGKYQDKGCTIASVPGKEKYEWYPWGSGLPTAENRGVTTKLKGKSATLETVKGAKVVCTSETGAGEIASSIYVIETMTFKGCSSAGLPCTTAGQAAGTIVAGPAYDYVVFQSGQQGGRMLQEGYYWIYFECAGGPLAALHVKIYYGATGATKFGKMVTKETVKYTATKGKQVPIANETYGETYLKAQIFSPAEEFIEEVQTGLTMTVIQKYNEKWEINPVV